MELFKAIAYGIIGGLAYDTVKKAYAKHKARMAELAEAAKAAIPSVSGGGGAMFIPPAVIPAAPAENVRITAQEPIGRPIAPGVTPGAAPAPGRTAVVPAPIANQSVPVSKTTAYAANGWAGSF